MPGLTPRRFSGPLEPLNCAHGCPACPHPATFFDEGEGAATLLPASRLAIDGQALDFETLAAAAAAEGDVELDFADADLE